MKKVKEYNEYIKSEIKVFIADEDDDLGRVNYAVARNYLSFLAKGLKESPCHIEWKNESTRPQNLFQVECYLESGRALVGCFVYVSAAHKVIGCRSEIHYMDEEWDAIKKI